MTGRFKQRTVVVTGGSCGLGRSLALAFAREDAFVGIGFKSCEEEAEQTLSLVREVGATGMLLRADLRDEHAIERAFDSLFAVRGSIDVLINNAAVLDSSLFPTIELGEWDAVMGVNLRGAFACARVAARLMLRTKRGAIVNIGSVAADRARAGRTIYAASKAGLLGLTKVLASELAPHGIRVNTVVPGLLQTGMGARADRTFVQSVIERVPLGRAGDPDEVARAVLFLASDEASYVVGATLVVDCGLSI